MVTGTRRRPHLSRLKMLPQRKPNDRVFGPFDSRRLGRSLGVNPLPDGPKRCTFDCVYCECGQDVTPVTSGGLRAFPTVAEMCSSLERAASMFASDELDSLTIAGNGEPTLFPRLGELVDAVIDARDRFWPRARTVILTNGTLLDKPSVRYAIGRLDRRIVKLDAGIDSMLDQLNRPGIKLTIESLVGWISMIEDVVIQSMFVHGPMDNTQPRQLREWAPWIRLISPREVQVYSVQRMPSYPVLPVERKDLERIAQYVENYAGVPAVVY